MGAIFRPGGPRGARLMGACEGGAVRAGGVARRVPRGRREGGGAELTVVVRNFTDLFRPLLPKVDFLLVRRSWDWSKVEVEVRRAGPAALSSLALARSSCGQDRLGLVSLSLSAGKCE